MRIISQDFKQGTVVLQIDSADDLWYVSQLLDPSDVLKGKTTRKVKKTDEGDALKRTITLAIRVERCEFGSELRVTGKVVEGPEDVPLGSYHTIEIAAGSVVTLTKEHWLEYQKQRLKEAAEQNKQTLLLCVFDREEAFIAKTLPSGYEVLTHAKGVVAKKAHDNQAKGNFYVEIIAKLSEYNVRFKPSHIIIASPMFWNEELLKCVTDMVFKKKIITATCSQVAPQAIDEVLKRPETKATLAQERVAKELELVDVLLEEIAKNGKAAYGINGVLAANNMGAIDSLLMTDSFVAKKKEVGEFESINELMKLLDKKKGLIHIVSSAHSGGQALDGLGGIGALLRYVINRIPK